MEPWILHARLELYKGMMAQSWSGVFLWHCMGSFERIPNPLNAIRYLELLGDHLHPLMPFCYPHGFQQGNCTSYKSRLATGWLEDQSSDFSVIN
ncbi:transposable element Tcb2 transposase [Trichonephila clavipes]|nr:transposable element Tcb2 transposase [Trichonephila clavipes]